MTLGEYLRTATGRIKAGATSGFFFVGDAEQLYESLEKIEQSYYDALLTKREAMEKSLKAAQGPRRKTECARLLASYNRDLDNWTHFRDREVTEVYRSVVEDAMIVVVRGNERNDEPSDSGPYGELNPERMPDDNAIELVSAVYKDIANQLINAYKKKAVSEELLRLYEDQLQVQRDNIEQADAIIRMYERYFGEDPYNLLLKSDAVAEECKRRAENDLKKEKRRKEKLRKGER